MSQIQRFYLVVTGSFFLAIVCTVMPLSTVLEPLRPAWAALVLLYWNLHFPHRIGIATGFCVGLLLDGIHGGLLGQYPLALAVAAYLALRLHQRIVVFPLWQQAVSVGSVLAVYMTIILWINGITGHAPGTWLYWLPLLTSSLMWPALDAALGTIRQLFQTG